MTHTSINFRKITTVFEENSKLYKKFIPKMYKETNDFVSSLNSKEYEEIQGKFKKIDEEIAAIHRSEMPTERKKDEMDKYKMEFIFQHQLKVLKVLGDFYMADKFFFRIRFFGIMPINFQCLYNPVMVCQ
jgi:hypothetical protein